MWVWVCWGGDGVVLMAYHCAACMGIIGTSALQHAASRLLCCALARACRPRIGAAAVLAWNTGQRPLRGQGGHGCSQPGAAELHAYLHPVHGFGGLDDEGGQEGESSLCTPAGCRARPAAHLTSYGQSSSPAQFAVQFAWAERRLYEELSGVVPGA